MLNVPKHLTVSAGPMGQHGEILRRCTPQHDARHGEPVTVTRTAYALKTVREPLPNENVPCYVAAWRRFDGGERRKTIMRVYVTVDIEGIAGVVHSEEGAKGNPEYERARRLMTGEASAVVSGILEADPRAEVTVVDVHGPYRNIIPEELHEQATLFRGKPRVYGMMHGIDRGYDAAIFVGVHGKAGTHSSVLSHTFTGTILDVRINGISMGELGLNAAIAGAYDVPVLLVSGDQTVDAEAHELFGDDIVTVQVKESFAHLSSESLHPNVACRRLQAAAARAVRDSPSVAPLKVETPVSAEVELARPSLADLAEMIDGAERLDGRTLRFVREDMPSMYRVLRLITVLCSTPL